MFLQLLQTTFHTFHVSSCMCGTHSTAATIYTYIHICIYVYINVYYIPYVYMFIYICVHKRQKAAVEKQLELKFFAVYIRIYIYYTLSSNIYICIHTHSSTLHTNVDKDLLLLESGGT